MSKNLSMKIRDILSAPSRHNHWNRMFAILALVILAGCKSPTALPPGAGETLANRAEAITLREGDVLRVTFPGSPSLDTQPMTVRQDGMISLNLVGEVKVVGMTPRELEAELAKRYASQLVSKEVLVTVVSSSYAVYVSGAVMRPGKVSSNRPLTILEAIMEAGGYDKSKSNLKAVQVIRQEPGGAKTFTLNLRDMLKGRIPPFYLKPSDIIYVPEKFAWF